MTLDQRSDFLTGSAPSIEGDENYSVIKTNKLLTQILSEIRRQDLTQRCVVDTQYTNAADLLTNASDIVDIRFLSSGKPVLAQYLTITNNCAFRIYVGLNEPVILDSAGNLGTGIEMDAGEIFQLPVSIEKIQIRLACGVAVGNAVSINNKPTGVPANGVVQVYAWTHTSSDKDETV